MTYLPSGLTQTAAFRSFSRSPKKITLSEHAGQAPPLHSADKRAYEGASGFTGVIVDQERVIPSI